MFHESGVQLVLKSMIGEIPAAMTHLSFGIGGSVSNDTNVRFRQKNLGMEVLRVPIQSSYVELEPQTEDAESFKKDYQVVIKGEIPTSLRIAYDEIGIWSGSRNVQYGDHDSKLLLRCDKNEIWLDGLDGAVINESGFFNAVRREFYDSDTVALKRSQPRLGTSAVKVPLGTSVFSQKEVSLNEYDLEDEIKVAFAWAPSADDFIGNFPSMTGSIGYTTYLYTETQNGVTYEHALFDQVQFAWTESSLSTHNAYFVRPHKIREWTGYNITSRIIGIAVAFNSINATYAQNGAQVDVQNMENFLLLDAIRIDKAVTNNPAYGLILTDHVGFLTNNAAPIEKLNGLDGHVEHRVRMFANSTGESQV